MYRIFLVFIFVSSAVSQLTVPGKCQKPEHADGNVNVQMILGTYYQLARITNADEYGECTTTTFGIYNLTAGTVFNREVLSNGTARTWSGLIVQADDFTFIFDYGVVKYTNYVLATDNMNYVMIYSCKDVPNTNSKHVWSWVLSKTKQLSEEGQEGVTQALLDNAELLQASWHITDQTKC